MNNEFLNLEPRPRTTISVSGGKIEVAQTDSGNYDDDSLITLDWEDIDAIVEALIEAKKHLVALQESDPGTNG